MFLMVRVYVPSGPVVSNRTTPLRFVLKIRGTFVPPGSVHSAETDASGITRLLPSVTVAVPAMRHLLHWRVPVKTIPMHLIGVSVGSTIRSTNAVTLTPTLSVTVSVALGVPSATQV